METARIAQVLDEMGTMLEINGENPFRCRAYHTAAQSLVNLPDELSQMIADGRLAEVPGIGETMHAKIVQLATTGQLPAYEELRRRTPPGLVALLRVPGLGPKKIKALHEELKIESLADLRAAAESGRIAALKGFGDKTEKKILEGIAFVEKSGDRILQSHALRLVAPIIEAVRGHRQVIRAEVCGSLRRRAETIGDLDILCSSKKPAEVVDAFVELPQVATVLAHGPTKASVRLADGVQCDLRAVEDDQFAFALHYFTGSKAHNIAMRKRALARGLSLNEYALAGDGKSVRCRTEAELFEALGLAEIPPELREDAGEIEAAEKGRLPQLIDRADLKGTFHCHTEWSDGAATLAEMAQAARDRGLHYLGIADHSRSAGYAGGLSIERVRAPMGRDRCLEQVVRLEVPRLQGDRVRYPAGRLARLPRRGARRVRLRGGQRPLEFRPDARADDRSIGARRVQSAGHDDRPPDRAVVAGARRLRRGSRRGDRRRGQGRNDDRDQRQSPSPRPRRRALPEGAREGGHDRDQSGRARRRRPG